MKTINKKLIQNVFSNNIYLLGVDENNIKYWLNSPSWDCEWYWGFGYIHTYTNNNNPEKSKDIDSLSHIGGYSNPPYKDQDYNFLNDSILIKTTYNLEEKKELIELFNEFYSLRGQANKAHNTDNAIWIGLNKFDLPKVINRIIEILTPAKEKLFTYNINNLFVETTLSFKI
jgi:hypothetical protein